MNSRIFQRGRYTTNQLDSWCLAEFAIKILRSPETSLRKPRSSPAIQQSLQLKSRGVWPWPSRFPTSHGGFEWENQRFRGFSSHGWLRVWIVVVCTNHSFNYQPCKFSVGHGQGSLYTTLYNRFRLFVHHGQWSDSGYISLSPQGLIQGWCLSLVEII